MGSGEYAEDRVAQFWTLAQRARASMRYGLDAEHLPDLMADIRDLMSESPVPGIRIRARALVREHLLFHIGGTTLLGFGDSA